jgi:hypothetical protein
MMNDLFFVQVCVANISAMVAGDIIDNDCDLRIDEEANNGLGE